MNMTYNDKYEKYNEYWQFQTYNKINIKNSIK